jgi:YHS domain-containing protein
MKKLLMAGALMALATAAVAAPQSGTKDKKAAPTEILCSVMTTKKVNVKDATAKGMFADYKGNRYFFCCGGCPSAFKASPAKYAKNAHIPTPKTGKPAAKQS